MKKAILIIANFLLIIKFPVFSQELFVQPRLRASGPDISYQWDAFLGPQAISELEFYEIVEDWETVSNIKQQLEIFDKKSKKADIWGYTGLGLIIASCIPLAFSANEIYKDEPSDSKIDFYGGTAGGILSAGIVSCLVGFCKMPGKPYRYTPYYYAQKKAKEYNQIN